MKVTSPVASTITEASVFAPSRNRIGPAGIFVTGLTGKTFAVKVSGCPEATGFAETMSVVVVGLLPVVPVFPVNVTVWGLPGALSVIFTDPPSKKDDDGEGWY